MPSSLSRTESLSLLSLFAACVGIIANTFQGDGEPLIASIAFSGIAFSCTYALIRWLGDVFIRAGLKGKDMSKRNAPIMYAKPITVHVFLLIKQGSPETMGTVCAVVYLLIIIVFIPFPFYKDIVVATSGGGNRDLIKEPHQVEIGRYLHRFPHSKVSESKHLSQTLELMNIARLLSISNFIASIRCDSRSWRRSV